MDNQNVEVVEKAGHCAKFGQSLLCAFCAAPLILLGATMLVGSNEKNAVCMERALIAGEETVKEVGCTTTGSDTLVLFTCDMQKDGLKYGSQFSNYDSVASFLPKDMDYTGTGLQVIVQMYQCVEHASTHTHKDGDKEVKVTTYTYSKEWVSGPVDSGDFKKLGSKSFELNCNVHNPPWPEYTPEHETLYAEKVKVGSFTLEGELIHRIPVNKLVYLANFTPGWEAAGTGRWENDDLAVRPKFPITPAPGDPLIGTLRVTLLGTNWHHKELTVMGHEKSGVITRWTAPSTWQCEGFTLAELMEGTVSREDLFERLQSAADSMKWVMRVIGFLVMWCAFAIMAAPCGAVADCIPFIGPCLGDVVDAITCAVSCLPASACCFLVAGFMWVFMRPMVGIPMLLLGGGLIGGLVVFKMQSKAKKAEGGAETEPLAE